MWQVPRPGFESHTLTTADSSREEAREVTWLTNKSVPVHRCGHVHCQHLSTLWPLDDSLLMRPVLIIQNLTPS
jgi:hypothetical protein